MIRIGKIIQVISLGLLTLWPAIMVQGQETLSYEGPFEIKGYKGTSTFQYRLQDSDTIYDGPFRMQNSNLGALLKGEDVSYLFQGNFRDGVPEGDWRFQFGRFNSDSLTEVVGYQYELKISGLQEEAYGSLNGGKPQGKWICTINKIKNSELEKSLFRSSMEFNDGIPQKSFQIENSNTTLVGRFLRDGLAHDEWALYADDKSGGESWYFSEGRLERIVYEVDGERRELFVFPEALANNKVINLDERFLEILKLRQQLVDSSGIVSSEIGKLLAENAKYYKRIDTIFAQLGNSVFLPEFRVKVPHYPLDSLEIAQLDSISTLYKQAQRISNSYLENTQLNILKLSDEEALELYGIMDSISAKFLKPLGRMVAFHDNGIWECIPKTTLMGQVWPNGFPPKDERLQTLGLERHSESEFLGNSIASALKAANYANSNLEAIASLLSPKLIEQQRQQDFIAVEEQLIAQIKNLTRRIDSVGNEIPKEHRLALEQVKLVAEGQLSTYSNTTDLNKKLDLGKQLVICFEHLDQLENAILGLQSRQEEIEAAYEDQIWNPFMANIMTEKVKKRITAAYNKVLLPYYLERVSTELKCENAEELAGLFGATHTRMLELREEDTRKLERKLRREQNPNIIINLFNISAQPLTN
ncbi:MAG: hypothetical protein AB3N14_08785 [Flavobacteriaceae bacterium]